MQKNMNRHSDTDNLYVEETLHVVTLEFFQNRLMTDIEIKEGEEYVVLEDPGVKEKCDVQLEVMRPPLDSRLFDGFDGFDLPDLEDNAYEEICEHIDMKYGGDDSEYKIDKLYKKLKMQNNRLQDIKQRKASKYDQSTIENELRRAAQVQ